MADGLLLAGAAKEDITPAVGTLLYGYVPDSVSTSVHDGLELTAVALGNGKDSALLISATLGDLNTGLSDDMRKIAGEEAGIDPLNVIIASTHTHSAPNVSGMEGWGDIDRSYVDGVLLPALRKASRRAAETMVSAEIACGVTRSEVGINRRQQLRDGNVVLGQNPWGCFDPTMTVIAVRDRDTKKSIVNIIHYGCHGTAAGNNREISRDWSGVMTDRVQRETGTLTTFFNGAVGDVGPRLTNGHTTGDITYAEELGGQAAFDAIRALRALGGYASGGFSIARGTMKIPRKPLLPESRARERLATYEEPEKLINISRLEYAYYRAVADAYDKGEPSAAPDFEYPQAVVTLGDAAFVPFPFEIFSEISMRLRAYSPFVYTLSLSNANGYEAYLPVESELVRGGYEVGCFRFSGPHPLVDNADQILIDRNLELLEAAMKAR